MNEQLNIATIRTLVLEENLNYILENKDTFLHENWKKKIITALIPIILAGSVGLSTLSQQVADKTNMPEKEATALVQTAASTAKRKTNLNAKHTLTVINSAKAVAQQAGDQAAWAQADRAEKAIRSGKITSSQDLIKLRKSYFKYVQSHSSKTKTGADSSASMSPGPSGNVHLDKDL